MSKQLRMLAGVAVFAALVLAGTVGAFAVGVAQPVQADHGSTHATRSFTPASGTVEPGGSLTVHIQRGDAFVITETLPAGFTFASTTLEASDYTMDGQTVEFTVFLGSSFDYTVTAPSTAGSYTFAGTAKFDRDRANDRPVGGLSNVTVRAGDTGGGQMPMALMVDALPRDPGAAAQITVEFPINHGLNIDESIVLEVGDDLGVPSSIAAGNVSIHAGDDTASPRSVVVETNSPEDRFKITLFIGDMSDEDGAQNLDAMGGDVTVTFRQEAGITNRTEGGSDDWHYRTSRQNTLTEIDEDKIYKVPFLVKLSSYGDSRGEEITVTGQGFKNGTTVRFWRDADGMGDVDPTEVVLCSATATGDDIAECSFDLSNPPFMGGKMGNYINAIDGRNNTATKGGGYSLPVIELEPSMSVSPKTGNPGDNINVQLYDFMAGDRVSQIQFGRRPAGDVCGGSKPACPSDYGTVDANGSLSFSFEIPNGITPGSQDLRIHAGQGNEPKARNDNTTFAVGLGGLQLAETDVLPNQRIHVTGSGFTTRGSGGTVYIGSGARPSSHGCGNGVGAVTLGGTPITWDRVNDGEAIEVTSGGTWAASIDLPVDSRTTTAGTRELKVVDCRAGVATVDLTFPTREVTMSPAEGRVGSEVIITGRNFPAFNDDGSDVEIEVEYDAGDGDTDDDDVEPDGLGNFTVILEVPEDAGIPSNNTVTVQFTVGGHTVVETRNHRVPQGTISFGATSGTEGSLLSITAEGFARYTSVDEIMFGNRDITPSPKPSTGTTGDGEFEVRIPGADPGIYIIKVKIDRVTASQTFTVVSGSGVVDGSVDSILANVMSEDALDRVFKFNNETKEWQWYINDPAFASTNNLAGLSSGDLVWIKVSKSVTADILGTSTTLTCINEGAENEDCWNQISIP